VAGMPPLYWVSNMNNSQKKLIGSVLAISGLALLAYGGYELYLTYDYNQQMNQVDESLGGLVSGLSSLIGSDVKYDYTKGAILAGIGLLDLLLGWIILGKSQ
jgi:hypothetical protein